MCLRSVVMLCYIISVGAGSKPPRNTDVGNTIFSISFKNNVIACDQTRENPSYVTVQEEGSLRLQTKFLGRRQEVYVTYFRCSTANYLNNEIVGHYEDELQTLMLVPNVKANMAGIWDCTIRALKYTNGIQPQARFLDVNPGQWAHCFLKLHIRVKETPQHVLVNNMIVPTSRTALANKLYDHVAEYRFLEGDMVNVLCVPGNDIVGNNKHNITLQYDFAAQLNDMFETHRQVPSTQGYGFRTKLQLEHDNTIMICNCTGPEDYTTVQVKFRLLDPSQSDDYEYIKINGSTARQPKDLAFTYLFFENEGVDIVCDTDETSDGFGANYCKRGSKKFSPLECICYKNGREVPVFIKPWSYEFQEAVRLSVDLPVNNTVMELYDSRGYKERHSWIYYEFNIGDTILPTCAFLRMGDDAIPAVKYKLFNGTATDTVNNITFTSAHDNTLFECFVFEDDHSSTVASILYYKNITVLFRKRVITTTTVRPMGTGSMLDSLSNNKLLIGCGVLIIVTVLGWLIYKRGHRHFQIKQTDGNQPLECELTPQVNLVNDGNGRDEGDHEYQYIDDVDHQTKLNNECLLSNNASTSARKPEPPPRMPSNMCTSLQATPPKNELEVNPLRDDYNFQYDYAYAPTPAASTPRAEVPSSSPPSISSAHC